MQFLHTHSRKSWCIKIPEYRMSLDTTLIMFPTVSMLGPPFIAAISDDTYEIPFEHFQDYFDDINPLKNLIISYRISNQWVEL